MNPAYLDTARLLTKVAPLVFVDDTFALKGGTAINGDQPVSPSVACARMANIVIKSHDILSLLR